MKITLFLLATVMTAVVYGGLIDDVKHRVAWEAYKLKHLRTHLNPFKDTERYKIFVNNLKNIEKRDPKAHKIGLNKYADLSNEEFNSKSHGFLVSQEEQAATQMNLKRYVRAEATRTTTTRPATTATTSTTTTKAPPRTDIPSSFDWRDHGVNFPVVNQGECNSCYAFATVEAMQAQIFIRQGRTVSLSQQNILDCANGTNGCSGGANKLAYNYIIQNGASSLKSYPYEYTQGKCRYNSSNVVANETSYQSSPQFDEEALKQSVYLNGPHSVAIDGSSNDFQLYESGIFYNSECSSTATNHAMLLVGYGTNSTTNQDYWILKNSWDTDWGMNGYIYMTRNKNNHCGIATYPTYPVV